MSNPMSLECCRVTESFRTSRAFVRFLSSMDSFMFRNIASVGEDFVAVTTGPGFLLLQFDVVKHACKKVNLLDAEIIQTKLSNISNCAAEQTPKDMDRLANRGDKGQTEPHHKERHKSAVL